MVWERDSFAEVDHQFQRSLRLSSSTSHRACPTIPTSPPLRQMHLRLSMVDLPLSLLFVLLLIERRNQAAGLGEHLNLATRADPSAHTKRKDIRAAG
jgi:hypothetical protein